MRSIFTSNWVLASFFAILSVSVMAGSLCGQVASESGQADSQDKKEESQVPEGRQFYKGRQIADFMSHQGAGWLTRDNREEEERCSMLLTNMGLRPGMVVCDMGVGNGYYALQIAELIGPKGQVMGVDIQPEMLDLLRERMEKKGIDNVTPVLGSVHNPRMAPESVDLVLMVDVYHEFSHPEIMLRAIRKSLKPDGVICLVEYRLEDPKVPIKRLHKMSKEQILKEYEPNGYKLVSEFDNLPWQHVMFFGKDEDFKEEESTIKDEDDNDQK